MLCCPPPERQQCCRTEARSPLHSKPSEVHSLPEFEIHEAELSGQTCDMARPSHVVHALRMRQATNHRNKVTVTRLAKCRCTLECMFQTHTHLLCKSRSDTGRLSSSCTIAINVHHVLNAQKAFKQSGETQCLLKYEDAKPHSMGVVLACRLDSSSLFFKA
eukprot:4240392-Amphidinium_carterae.2